MCALVCLWVDVWAWGARGRCRSAFLTVVVCGGVRAMGGGGCVFECRWMWKGGGVCTCRCVGFGLGCGVWVSGAGLVLIARLGVCGCVCGWSGLEQ